MSPWKIWYPVTQSVHALDPLTPSLERLDRLFACVMLMINREHGYRDNAIARPKA